MNFEVIVEAIDQSVIRIGQVAVGGEARRPDACEQNLETRMLADLEAPAEGIGTQAIHRQRHQ